MGTPRDTCSRHLRQDSLAMEKEWLTHNWLTHNWWHRVFATIFGMCVVDSFLAYKFEAEGITENPENFTTFMGKLAMSLIQNTIDHVGMVRRNNDEDEENDVEVSCSFTPSKSSFFFLFFPHFRSTFFSGGGNDAFVVCYKISPSVR